MVFPHVHQRSEFFGTLINFHYYGDVDRKEFSRTCKTLHLDCIGLKDAAMVKIIEMSRYLFLIIESIK